MRFAIGERCGTTMADCVHHENKSQIGSSSIRRQTNWARTNSSRDSPSLTANPYPNPNSKLDSNPNTDPNYHPNPNPNPNPDSDDEFVRHDLSCS